jgi:hypothetical protein
MRISMLSEQLSTKWLFIVGSVAIAATSCAEQAETPVSRVVTTVLPTMIVTDDGDDGEMIGDAPFTTGFVYHRGSSSNPLWPAESSSNGPAKIRQLAFFRFTLPQEIPSGATITSSAVQLYGASTNSWDPAVDALRIYAQKSADSSQFDAINDYPGDVGGTVLSSAHTRWPAAGGLTWSHNAYNSSVSLNTIIQELVDGYGGLAAGSHIQILVTKDNFDGGDSAVAITDYANAHGTNTAKLDITFQTQAQ